LTLRQHTLKGEATVPCRYGMVLQQCAHFYNNIATQMIPCQKPLMLADAVEFEKVRRLLNVGCKHTRACFGAIGRVPCGCEPAEASRHGALFWPDSASVCFCALRARM
jgi:hypothetical protein